MKMQDTGGAEQKHSVMQQWSYLCLLGYQIALSLYWVVKHVIVRAKHYIK